MISEATKVVKQILTALSPNLPAISDSPWLTQAAKDWFEEILTKDMRVFEYGSGGSTLYIARRVRQVVSIENSYSWFLAVKKALRHNKITNVEILFVESEKLAPETRNFVSSDPKYRNISFRNYVMTINKFPDRYFDLLFVDGRARSSCLVTGFLKVKDGGYIFLDDSERPGYESGIRKLNKYWKKEFKGTNQDVSKVAMVWKVVHE